MVHQPEFALRREFFLDALQRLFVQRFARRAFESLKTSIRTAAVTGPMARVEVDWAEDGAVIDERQPARSRAEVRKVHDS